MVAGSRPDEGLDVTDCETGNDVAQLSKEKRFDTRSAGCLYLVTGIHLASRMYQRYCFPRDTPKTQPISFNFDNCTFLELNSRHFLCFTPPQHRLLSLSLFLSLSFPISHTPRLFSLPTIKSVSISLSVSLSISLSFSVCCCLSLSQSVPACLSLPVCSRLPVSHSLYLLPSFPVCLIICLFSFSLFLPSCASSTLFTFCFLFLSLFLHFLFLLIFPPFFINLSTSFWSPYLLVFSLVRLLSFLFYSSNYSDFFYLSISLSYSFHSLSLFFFFSSQHVILSLFYYGFEYLLSIFLPLFHICLNTITSSLSLILITSFFSPPAPSLPIS